MAAPYQCIIRVLPITTKFTAPLRARFTMQKIDQERARKINSDRIKAKLQHLKHCEAILEDLPDLMVNARQDAKITQVQLGSELGVKYQQVSADEGDKYQNAALHKLRRTLDATIKLIEQKIES